MMSHGQRVEADTSDFFRDWNLYAGQQKQIPVTFTDDIGRTCAFDGFGYRGIPQFLSTCNNLDAARTLGTQTLWSGGGLGLSMSGSGLNKVGVWDGGAARTSHREFSGRVLLIDSTSSSLSGHTTAVIGMINSAGMNPDARGMSNAANVRNWNFTNDNAEIIAAAPSLYLSNHSYATTTAWQYISGNLYWYGDSSLHPTRDWKFGYYDNRSRIWDSVMVQQPYFLMVKAAGNDRGSGVAPGATHYYWNGTAWALTNTTRDTVGPYDCISTFGNAKNILTIGAIPVSSTGYDGNTLITPYSFSSWGPTDDGRIKPDLVAASGSILSVGSANDSAYATLGGTSIAAPNVTGSLLLLQQLSIQQKGIPLRNHTLKGLAIHSATRCKPGLPGPDYECGWGVPNLKKAAQFLLDTSRNTLVESFLNNNDSLVKEIYYTSGDSLRITLCWTDPKSITANPVYNDTTPKLVNDLDVRLSNMAGQILTRPFVMNPANPSLAATTGDNTKDNVEQIFLTGLPTGKYRVRVNHKGQLQSQQAQPYSLLISGAPLYTATMPVTWLSVSAIASDWNLATVSWSTASEANLKEYEVQFSNNGTDFTKAHVISPISSNSSHRRDYQASIAWSFGLPEISYYRIKQIDLDGSVTYSKTVSLQSTEGWEVKSIFPNPFSAQLNIILSKPMNGIGYQLYQLTGNKIMEGSWSAANGNSLHLEGASLPEGMYLLLLTDAEGRMRFRAKVVRH